MFHAWKHSWVRSFSITPDGEEKIVADRIHALLSNPPKREGDEGAAPSIDVSGPVGRAHRVRRGKFDPPDAFISAGERLRGTHRGDFVSRDVSGRVEGSTIRIRSSYTEEHGDSLVFSFNGRLADDVLSGTLDMGEYLAARWTARRS